MTTATAPEPTSTEVPAAALQPVSHVRKPALPALTGLRTLLALTILLFHFTPSGLTWGPISLYPLVNIGYVFVSFFFLISGFILSYNYADRPGGVNIADFWMARLSRLYPVYVLTMLISIPMLIVEWHARSHTEFWMGAIATPLLVQGFFPHLATFWNTVSWTLSCEIALYLMFPWLLRLRWPRGAGTLLVLVIGFWVVGLIPHTIYVFTNPDHLPGPADRYSGGFWIDFPEVHSAALSVHVPCGLTLGRLHEAAKLTARSRMIIGVVGFAAVWFTAYHLTDRLPYIMIHGGLLTPLFAAVILGLSGPSPLASVFSVRPLVVVGASTYCLYLLHFNVFVLLHLHHVPERLHVARFDPWISYVFVVLLALAVQKFVEHPCQVAIGNWWKQRRAAQAAR